MVRAMAVATHFGAEALDIESIGDGPIAFKSFDGDGDPVGIDVLWRSGDALGQLRTGIGDLEDAVAFARSANDLLETAGPATMMAASARDVADDQPGPLAR